MRFKLLIISVLFSISATAQIYDTTVLRNYINANIVPNSSRSITATQLNNSLIGLLNVSGKYKVDSIWKRGDSLIYSIGGEKGGFLIAAGQAVDSAWAADDTLYLHKATGSVLTIKMGYYTTIQSDTRYLQKVDTASLSSRINSKVNISDTVSMLNKYLRKADTVTLSNRINLAVPLSQKAIANGVATLGSDGRVPATQLPSGSEMYKGTWTASTNTPSLADGTGTAGWRYRVVGDSTTRDLGSGSELFVAGDDVIHNGSIWQIVPSSNLISSVNGKTGTVVLSADDVPEGATNKYFTNAAETDPTVPADVKAITSTNITNWNSAFGWGNHASAGYLTATTGDARYPLLSGSYVNPSWLTSLPWIKITGAPAFITGNQTITATGDATGFGTTTIPLTLKNIGAAGTYTKVTTDAQGRVTVGANPTTLAGYGITDAYTKAQSDASFPTISNTVSKTAATSNPVATPVFAGDLNTIAGTDIFHVGAASNGPTSGVPGFMLSMGNTSTQTVQKTQVLLSYNVDDGFFYRKGSNASWNNWYQAASRQWANTTFAPITGSANYIQNQNASAQSGNSWISGNMRANNFYGNAGTGTLQFGMLNGTSFRWGMLLSGAESANAGSNWTLIRYSDGGGMATVMDANRLTGIVSMPSGFRSANNSGITGTGTGTVNQSILYFNESNNTTRQGYTGAINKDAYLVADDGNVNLRPGSGNQVFQLTPTALNLSTGLISLTNATGNLISFGTGSGAPTFTSRSPGTLIAIGNNITGASVDYAYGYETNYMWQSVPISNSARGWKWYGGTTQVAKLDGVGNLQINGSLTTQNVLSPSSTDLNLKGDLASRFFTGGTERVTISSTGILSVGNSTPDPIRSSPLQVQGNVWATDAYLLGTGSVPLGEFGISGTNVFVRTMNSTSDVLFQTNISTIRGRFSATTGNLELNNQIKIAGGAPGVGKQLTSDASGLATWSGAVTTTTRAVTGNVTITSSDYSIDLKGTGTGSTHTLTLPDPAVSEGRELEFFQTVSFASEWTANYPIYNRNQATMPPFTRPTIVGREKIKAISGKWVVVTVQD